MNDLRTGLPALLVVLVLVAGPTLAQDQSRIDRFSLGYDGVPLKYQRILDYHHPYPEGHGLLVKSASKGDPAVRAGLRRGFIIRKVNGRKVQSREKIRDIAIDNFGQPLTFKVIRKKPRYEHRLREDPFYEPRHGSPYQTEFLKVTYDTPGLERNPVVSGSTDELYHKFKFSHSPDTRTNTVYLNPTRAQKHGLNPCPVCFPSGEGGSIGSMLQDEIGLSSRGFVKGLTKGAPRIEDVPGEMTTLLERVSDHLLTDDLELQLGLFQADKMFAYGLPGGEIIMTYNLYQYTETPPVRAAFTAHLIAHADRGHDHKPVEENRIRSLIERAIQRTTGYDFKFKQLKEWSPALPGFSYFNEILEEGYGDPQEREAIFYGMVYLYKAGYPLSGFGDWIARKRDMQSSLHPYWLDFTLAHPIPLYIQYDIERWKELIPKNFKRKRPRPRKKKRK